MSATHPKIARRARLRFDEHEKKWMLLYPERGLVLNDSAAEIVKLCDGTRSVEEIVRVLADASKAPIARIATDVEALLARLDEKRLVE